jgi:hypothetical protein
VSHPREKLDQVCTWICGPSEAIGKIVHKLYGVIFFRYDGRVAIDDSQIHRCCSTAIMVTPLRGSYKAVTGEKDSFRHLLLIKPLH